MGAILDCDDDCGMCTTCADLVAGAHGACSSSRAGGFGPSGSRPDRPSSPISRSTVQRAIGGSSAGRSPFTVSHTFRAP